MEPPASSRQASTVTNVLCRPLGGPSEQHWENNPSVSGDLSKAYVVTLYFVEARQFNRLDHMSAWSLSGGLRALPTALHGTERTTFRFSDSIHSNLSRILFQHRLQVRDEMHCGAALWRRSDMPLLVICAGDRWSGSSFGASHEPCGYPADLPWMPAQRNRLVGRPGLMPRMHRCDLA